MADRVAQYEDLIQAAAKKHGVSPDELRAIMHVESRGRPDLVSPAGAQGLMQLMPEHTKGAKDPFDPAFNIDKGAEVLADSYDFMRKNGVPEKDLPAMAWSGYNRTPEHVLEDYKAGKGIGYKTDTQKGLNYPDSVKKELGGGASFEPVAQQQDSGGAHYTVLDDGRVPIYHDGKLKYTTPEHIGEAVNSFGARPLSLDDYNKLANQRALEEKYGSGFGNAVKAGVIGVLKGAVPGGEGLAVKTGAVSPEQARQYRKSFGGLQTAAEYGAMGLSALDGGEAGALKAGEKGVLKAGEEAIPAAFRGSEDATQVGARHFERATEKTVAGAPDFATGEKTVVPRGEEITQVAEPATQPNGVPVVEFPKNGKPSPIENFGRGGSAPAKTAETAAAKRGARVGAEKGVATRVNNDRLPFEPHTKIEPSEALTQGVGGFGNDEVTVGRSGKPIPQELSDEELEALRGPTEGTVSDTAPTRVRADTTKPGLTEADLTRTAPSKTAAGIPRAFQGTATDADITARTGEDFTTPVGGFGNDEATLGRGGKPIPQELSDDELEALQGLHGTQAAPGNADATKVLPSNELTAADETVTRGLPNDATQPGAPVPTVLDKGEPTLVDATQTRIPGEPATKVGGPAMGLNGEPTQIGGAPVAPLAPPPEVSFAKQAQRLLSRPNKTIWGMGKEFGSAVEEAMGGGLAGKTAGGFARGALESVPYTIGQNYDDAMVNQEKATPERLVAGLGLNALFAGSLGGMLGAAEHGLNKLKLNIPHGNALAPTDIGEVAKNGAGSLDSIARRVSDSVDAAYRPTADGLPPPKYQRVAQLLGDRVGAATQQKLAFLGIASKVADSLPNTAAANEYRTAVGLYARALEAAKTDADVFRATDEFKRILDNGINWDKVGLGNANPVKDEIVKVRGAMKQALENTEIFGDAAKFQEGLNSRYKLVQDLLKKKDGVVARFMSPGVLAGESKLIYDPVKFGHFVTGLNSENALQRVSAERSEKVLGEYLAAQRDLVGYLRNEIHQPLGNPGMLEGLHDTLGANDEKLATALKNARDLTESQKKSVYQRLIADRGTRLGVAGALMAMGVPHAFLLTYTVSYALERALGLGLGRAGIASSIAEHGTRMTQVIRDGMKLAIKGAKPFVGGGSVGALKGFSLIEGHDGPSGKDRADHVKDVADQVSKLVADPEKTLQRVAASTYHLQVANPELAQQVQATAMAAVNYLHDKAPKDPLPPSPFPNPVPFRPGHAETARFESTVETVMNPLVLIRDFATNKLSTEQVMAVQQVYPELYEQMKSEAMQAVAQADEPLDYQHRLGFERLTGTKVDWASQDVSGLQQLFPKTPPPNPSAGGAANKPRPSTSAKSANMLANQAQPGLQSAIAGLS